MHEVTLVLDLLLQVAQAMQSNNIKAIKTIQIEVGPLSGVEAMLIEQAYFALVPDTPFENVRLEIDQPLLTAICRECRDEFAVIDFHFVCPSCSSSKVQVTSGDEMRLVSITTDVGNASEEKAGVAVQ